MFTGLVQSIGTVRGLESSEAGTRLLVEPGRTDWKASPGDSISISGCCLTVAQIVRHEVDLFAFDVVPQTLQCTTLGDLQVEQKVNMEHAATMSTLMGGHLVQGHVDGIATVSRIDRNDGEYRVTFQLPEDLVELAPPRGSISIDGVSLTIAETGGGSIEVVLVPTTLQETTLGSLGQGDRVNIESDCIARSVVHWLQTTRGSGS